MKLSVISPKSQPILQPFRRFSYVTAHSPTLSLLHLHHSSFCTPSFASPTSQALHAHSPNFLSFHLRHRPFSNPSFALPMPQLILQPFHCFTYVIAHSLTLLSLLLHHRLFMLILQALSLHLRHSPFSNPSVALPTSLFISNPSIVSPTPQLIVQPFFHFSYIIGSSRSFTKLCHFTYVTAHSPTLPLLYLRHSSFSNPSNASPTSQLILQPFFCFSYVTGSSLMSPGELPMISSFCLQIK